MYQMTVYKEDFSGDCQNQYFKFRTVLFNQLTLLLIKLQAQSDLSVTLSWIQGYEVLIQQPKTCSGYFSHFSLRSMHRYQDQSNAIISKGSHHIAIQHLNIQVKVAGISYVSFQIIFHIFEFKYGPTFIQVIRLLCSYSKKHVSVCQLPPWPFSTQVHLFKTTE